MVADACTHTVSAILAPNKCNKNRFHGMKVPLGKGRAKTVQHIFQSSLLILLKVLYGVTNLFNSIVLKLSINK